MTSTATLSRSASRFADRYFPPPRFLLPNAAGVDISDASIKWLTFSGEPPDLQLASWGNEPLSPGIVVGGIVQDSDALGHALADIRPHLGASAAHAALPEEAAYVFGMRVPAGTERAQILSMIEFELDGRVPIPPSASVYDFNRILEDEEGTEIGVDVFPREVSEHYADAFAKSGIELLSLETEARSIARAVSSCHEDEPITLLVDFGRARTGFAVVKRGIPIFTSTVEVGGNSVFDALQRMFGYSREEAEHVSNMEGLLEEKGKGAKNGVEAILPTASALADEVERHFRYWDTRRNDEGKRVTPVGRIVLIGGSANLRGLPEYIAGRVHAQVSLGNAWRHTCNFDEYIPPINRRDSLQFATAVGLALRAF